jgi:hypothetical protein
MTPHLQPDDSGKPPRCFELPDDELDRIGGAGCMRRASFATDPYVIGLACMVSSNRMKSSRSTCTATPLTGTDPIGGCEP